MTKLLGLLTYVVSNESGKKIEIYRKSQNLMTHFYETLCISKNNF